MLSGFSLSRTTIVGNELSKMQQQSTASSPFSAYGDRPQMGLDIEYGQDPASGAAFFQTDGRKHDDLKQMLDSNKDGLKLEAMKRIIGMIARGRDASDLFPAVVKNVVSKNIEVKKLVYVYLVRYAEEQQDLALLSISTFQRALKDPNQLIRASALRVLSSIRVGMIAPIVMLAIKDSASDMSAYVRKTAAHAIPKLYYVDPDLKQELITVIEKLLSDRTTLVVGSAVMAFDEVCPERVDLIHKNYRKLCNLLVDVDEWGQVIIINMLTRYARTQFTDPNAYESDDQTLCKKKFYDDSSSSEENDNHSKSNKTKNKARQRRDSSSPTKYYVDLDHRLLLRQTKPLLQSRNASVVMAVAQLYHHIAPNNEVQIVAKALVRLLRSEKEVQSVVLTCIASMTIKRKSIFESHIKSFFVRSSDQTHLKILKLDILTNLASAANISMILREFQTYISSSDRTFVAATIQAIGRCAASIKEVTEICLCGLVHLLSNRDEHVVAESVVVIKKLLQGQSAEHYDIISQMAKLIDFITVAAARASIIWLIGEYNEKVPKIAPDVLRKMAKSFVDEENVVKLQILNLAVKLYITNSEQISLLCQYVFTLARYDTNYDIRDRARFLRQFILPTNQKITILTRNAREIFLSTKPAPSLESKYCENNLYQMGSLSHYLNLRATGYRDLPTFPVIAPDSAVRNIEGYTNDSPAKPCTTTLSSEKICKENNIQSSEYSDSDSSSSSTSSSESTESREKSKPVLKNTSNLIFNNSENINNKLSDENNSFVLNKNNVGTSDSETSSNSETETDSDSVNSTQDSESSSESEAENDRTFERVKELAYDKINNSNIRNTGHEKTQAKNHLDLLLELDDIQPVGSVMTPSLGGFLTPGTPQISCISLVPQNASNRIELVAPSYVEHQFKELLNKLVGNGLQIMYRYTRSPHLYSGAMVSIELQFINKASVEITGIKMIHTTLPTGMHLNEFAPIQQLLPNQITTSILGIDFNDSTYAVDLDIFSSVGKARVTLKPTIGELIRSVQITDSFFKEERTKLRGMNENQCRLSLSKHKVDFNVLKTKLCQIINVAVLNTVPKCDIYYFAGQTMSSKSLVLITLDWQTDNGKELLLTVNCEKMVIGSMVMNELHNVFTSTFEN